MTQVKFHFVLADGTPVSNTRFQVTLPKGAYQAVDSGVYLPSKITAETDADGKATLELEPLTSFQYTVAIADWKTGSSIKHKFYVPDSPTAQNLIDLVSLGDQNEYDFKQETIDLITNAKADTRNFREQAQAARDTALSHVNTALSHKQGAEAAEGRSEARATEALAYRNDVNDARNAMVLLKNDIDSVASTVNSDRAAVSLMQDSIVAKISEVNGIIVNELDPKLAQTETQLTELSTARQALETTLTDLENQVATINQQHTDIGLKATEINNAVEAFNLDVVNKISSVEIAADTQLASIESKKSYIELTLIPQINSTETNIENIYADAVALKTSLEEELSRLNQKLIDAENTLVSATTLQSDLTAQFNSIDSKITTEINPKVVQVNDDAVSVAADKQIVINKLTEATDLVSDLGLEKDWIISQKDYMVERINFFQSQVSVLKNDIGSIDNEVLFVSNQRDYFDNTLLPEIEGVRTEILNKEISVNELTDRLFLLSTNGGSIFTKEWPTVSSSITRNVDVSQEATHYMTINEGGRVELVFNGWVVNSTKYVVIVFTNAGRGVIQWPATMLWQSRENAVPIFKESGIDTVVIWSSPGIKDSAGGPTIFGAKVGR